LSGADSISSELCTGLSGTVFLEIFVFVQVNNKLICKRLQANDGLSSAKGIGRIQPDRKARATDVL